MRVLTFNLWHGLSPSSPLAFEALEPTTRRELRESLQVTTVAHLQPDFCFLQEVNPVGTRVPVLENAWGMRGDYQPDLVGLKVFGVGIPVNLNSGLAILGAKPLGMRPVASASLSRTNFNWVRKWASWQLREERFVLLTEALLPNWGKVLLVNTHLHHGLEATPKLMSEIDALAASHELNSAFLSELKERLCSANQRRMSEVTQLMRVIKANEKRYAGVILCGDFNAEPENEIFHIVKECGFRDAWTEAHPGEPGYTFNPQENSANHLLQSGFPLGVVIEDLTFSSKTKEELLTIVRRHESRLRRIDYVWFKPSQASVAVQGAELIGQPGVDGLAPSDHFGVLVDFKVG